MQMTTNNIDSAYRLKGLKFYRFIDDTRYDIVRLVKYDEVKKVYITRDQNDDTRKISADELNDCWIRLNPDGIMEFVICNVIDIQGDEVPDVMVTLRRKNEEGGIEPIPYAVCRQSVLDVFCLLQQNRYVAGMTITQDTCPPEVLFSGNYEYSKLRKQELVAVYTDDHLYDILSVINCSKYNNQLRIIKSRNKMDIPGFCITLYDLLHENYFMMEFHKAFNIHEFEFPKFDFEDRNTIRVLTEYIIHNKYEVPSRFYPVRFNKTIDLKDIKRSHILITSNSYKYPKSDIILLGYDISETVSVMDYVNKGNTPKEALKNAMRDLGWS